MREAAPIMGVGLRIGVVGAGGVAARHVRVLDELGECITAVTDVDAERADALAGTAGARAVPDVDAVIDSGVDAVYVCVPPFAHGPIEDKVIDAGLPLFVEKPLSASLPEAERLGARLTEAGTITATGYHWRQLDTLERARKVVAEHPPAVASAWWIDALPPPPWWARRSMSGGQVVEQATHVLDVLRVLCGELTVVDARSRRGGHAGPRVDDDVVDDATVAVLRSDAGALVSLTTACLAPAAHRRGVEILCPRVVLELTEDALTVAGDGCAGHWTPQVDPRVDVDRAFMAAVRSGDASHVRAPYDEALRTHRLAVAIAEQAVVTGGAAVGAPLDATPG